MDTLAAIDLGTNSFHMVVVRTQPDGSYEILNKEKEMVRLGGGVDDMDTLSPEAMDRGIMTLEKFVKIARGMDASIRTVATSALREARNQEEFINRARERPGIEIDVIPGAEEARLIYLGVIQALPVYNKKILMIDIGGGSTEFLIGFQGNPEFAVSLKLGAIRLTDKFFPNGSISDENILKCRHHIRIHLEGIKTSIFEGMPEMIVGSSGTIECIFDIIRMTEGRSGLTENVFTAEELDRVLQTILSADTVEQRSRIPGLDLKRAEIILGGAILLSEIFRILNIDRMYVSPYALREGVILDSIIRRNKIPDHFHELRKSSVSRLLHRYLEDRRGEIPSAVHTAKLALKLLHALLRMELVSGLMLVDEELLEFGALLHNVGIAVSHSAHHKHGYYLIKNSDSMLGFTPLEVELIALMARYHRKAVPSKKHDEYRKLPEDARRRLQILSSILRVVVCMDRSRKGVVHDLEVKLEESHVAIKLVPDSEQLHGAMDLSVELWSVELKKELLEEQLGRRIVFRISE